MSGHPPKIDSDKALDQALEFFRGIPEFPRRAGDAIRRAFDEVIDAERTGRWDLNDLEKTEKTYIGTKVEIVFRSEFELPRGLKLDNLIHGNEVDTKFSLTGGWMIPSEAIGELCLLVSGNDDKGVFSVGLIRASLDRLGKGENKDGKKGLSAEGKKHISWLVRDEPLPRNFILDLDPVTRTAIFSQPHATKRIRTLFRLVKNQIIPRSAILAVCRSKDSLKRARECKGRMLKEGVLVLCSTYINERQIMSQRGYSNLTDSDWLSVDL
jgi:hypothetical protein